MGLPFQGSFEAVSILQDKGRFREFLTANGFNVPEAGQYTSLEEALADISRFAWPVIVKPVDSAGSKGVMRADNPDRLADAVEYALSESHSGRFIIEDFLEMAGHSSDSEGFTVDGRLVFDSFSDQYFDPSAANPYTPCGYIWPSTMPQWAKDELRDELQRLMRLLDMRTGIYNIETRLCKDGKPYIMECSPRGGGNRLAEMIDIQNDCNIIANSVRGALGMELLPMDCDPHPTPLGEAILHCRESGIFRGIRISPEAGQYIVQTRMRVMPGESVQEFSGANHAIGTIVLQCEDPEELSRLIQNTDEWCEIIVETAV